MTNANLTSYQKGVHYAVMKLFSTLASDIKSLNNDICKYLRQHWKIISYLIPSTV
jgi:hypothetical protein